MNYGACCIIYGLALGGHCSITFYGHCVITTYFYIHIPTTIEVHFTLYGYNVDITIINLYVYVGPSSYLYIVVIAFGVCFVYVNFMAAVYGNIRVALYLYLFFIT